MKESSSHQAPDKKATRSEPANAPAALESPVHAARGLSLDALGNRATLALLRSGRLQRKARVSQPGDPLERDADRVADAVVSETPASAIRRGTTSGIVSGLDSGEPLPRDVRGLMETRFGEPFDDVLIHTGDRAAEAAEAVSARAFTVGSSVVFGAGEFAPESTEGRRLLAHELTHVVQQRGPGNTAAPESATEAEADRAAHDATAGGSVAVESSAHPGEIQRKPTPGSGRKSAEIVGSSITVDGLFMAYVEDPSPTKSRNDIWDGGSRILSVAISVLGRHYQLKKFPDGDQNAKDLDIVVDITSTNNFGRPVTSHVTVGSRTPGKPPTPKPPTPTSPTPAPQDPSPDQPRDQPEQQETKPDTRAETKPSSGGDDKVKSVEKKSRTEPGDALQDAQDLSPRELKTVGPGPRKNLLDAAARGPRDDGHSQLARDLITTTPDRDAGALSDALQADGGKLLSDLKSKADPDTATALDDAAKDLQARRIDAPEPDPGKDIAELTPEMKKKAGEIRALLENMGKRTHDLDENREADHDWPGVKAGFEAKFNLELRNVDHDVKRWNEQHALFGRQADSASDIAAAAHDEVSKAFALMRAAKTERELYEGWKAATHALWRANQMMDAKRSLERFESSVRSWNESQSGWASLASVPSSALGGVSRDRPSEIAAETRTKIEAALAQLRDANTREEKIEAATRLKQILADANQQLSAHKEDVEEGGERLIVGIEVVGVTGAAIAAPEIVIPGIIAGGGLGTIREGALTIDDPNHRFSGRAILDSSVAGGFIAPFAAGSSVVAYVVLPAAGIYSGSKEFEKGHYLTGGLDVVTALAPIGIKAATGKGPPVPFARQARSGALTLSLMMQGVRDVPGIGGTNPTASIPGGPEIAWVMPRSGTAAPTPGGVVIPDLATVSPDVTPGFDVGLPSPKLPAPVWAAPQVGSFTPGYVPNNIPFTVKVAPPPAAAKAGPGITIDLKPQQVERLTSAEEADKWTDLPGKTRTSLGKRYGYIVQELVRAIAGGGRAKSVLHYPNVDAALIAQLKAEGGRVVITEGRLKGGDLRFDFAEIDFDRGTVEVLDMAPSKDPAHLAKTRAYATELEKLTGFKVESHELHYVDEDGNLLPDLELVDPTK